MTADEVEIGLVYSDTGVASDVFRSARGGIEARLGVANEAGGVHGRTVVYDWRDDQGDLHVNGVEAPYLAGSGGAFALVEFTTVASGSAETLANAGVPVLGLGLEPVWTQYRNMFTSAAFAPVDTQGRFVLGQGGSRALLVRDALDPASLGLGEYLLASMRAVGLETVAPIEFNPATDDPSRIAEQIINSGADVLLGTITPQSFVEIFAAARSAGAQLDVALSSSGYDPAILPDYGERAVGMTVYSYYTPFEISGPALDEYRSAVRSFAPQLQPTDQEAALLAYVTTDLLLLGLEQAGACPSRESFIRALRSVSNFDAEGLVPPIDFTAPPDRLGRCLAFIRVDATGEGFDVVEPRLCGNSIDLATPQ